MPTLPLALSQRLAPALTVLSTSMPRPIAVDGHAAPFVVRRARMPKLTLFVPIKPIDAKDNSLPDVSPSVPADVSSAVLRGLPASSVAPAATTLNRAAGCVVPMPTLPVALNRALSCPLVRTTRGCESAVPRKFV